MNEGRLSRRSLIYTRAVVSRTTGFSRADWLLGTLRDTTAEEYIKGGASADLHQSMLF